LKALSSSFELVSSLKVDFQELFDQGKCFKMFTNMVHDFLNCKIGTIPFIYLGLPVDENSKKLST